MIRLPRGVRFAKESVLAVDWQTARDKCAGTFRPVRSKESFLSWSAHRYIYLKEAKRRGLSEQAFFYGFGFSCGLGRVGCLRVPQTQRLFQGEYTRDSAPRATKKSVETNTNFFDCLFLICLIIKNYFFAGASSSLTTLRPMQSAAPRTVRAIPQISAEPATLPLPC